MVVGFLRSWYFFAADVAGANRGTMLPAAGTEEQDVNEDRSGSYPAWANISIIPIIIESFADG